MAARIRIAVLCLIIANIIWGASFPIYKWSLDNVPPFTFVFLRFFLASFLILPFARHHLHIQRKDLKALFILSFAGITFSISFLFLGLQLSSSINAPIVLSSGPVFLMIASIFFLHEKPKKKVIAGMLISLFGVLAIILGPALLSGTMQGGSVGSILGNVFLLLATVGGVIHTINLKKLMQEYHPLAITFWSFVIGSLPLLPMVFFETHQQGLLMNLNMQGAIGILFGVIFASAIAHGLTSFGIKYIAANEVGIFTYVDPVATVLIAIPLLGESITPIYLFSAALVFLGIFIAEGRLHWHPLHKLQEKSSPT